MEAGVDPEIAKLMIQALTSSAPSPVSGDAADDDESDDESSCSEESVLPNDIQSSTLRSAATTYKMCQDRYDTDAAEISVSGSRDYEEGALKRTDEYVRHDMRNTVVNPPPPMDKDSDAPNVVIPVGVTKDFAAILVAPAGVQHHGQLDPAAGALDAAREYVDTVCDGVRAAETISEVKVADETYVEREQLDKYIAVAAGDLVSRTITKKARALEAHELEARQRHRKAAEEGVELDPSDKELARADLRAVTGLPDETPLDKDPRLVTMLRPRAMDSITCYEGETVPRKGKSATMVLAKFKRPDALQKLVTATQRANADEAKRAEKERRREITELAREISRIGTIKDILRAHDDGESVAVADLTMSLYLADVSRDQLTKKERKLVKRAIGLFQEVAEGADVPSFRDDQGNLTFRPLPKLLERQQQGCRINIDEMKVAVYKAQAEYTARVGNADSIPSGEDGELIIKGETYLEVSGRPVTRKLDEVLQAAVKTPKDPIMRELQRAVVAMEKIIGTLKANAASSISIDAKHTKNLATARDLIKERAEGMPALNDATTVHQLDALIAAGLLRQWDGLDGFDAVAAIHDAQFKLGDLIVRDSHAKRIKKKRDRKAAKQERLERRGFDFPVKLYCNRPVARIGGSFDWWPARRQSKIWTTGATAISRDTPEIAVGRTGGVSVHSLPAGVCKLDIKLHDSWGGRVNAVSINSRFVCGIFDFPEPMVRKTPCTGFVYHRASGKMHIIDAGGVPLTCLEPEPDRESYWVGTAKGGIFCISWTTGDLDTTVQSLLITATIGPVRRIRRAGRRLHAIVSSDMHSWDVIPQEGESLIDMSNRAGRGRHHRLVFPSDVDRWGPIYAIVHRDYKMRLIFGDVVRVLDGPKRTTSRLGERQLHPFPLQQHISFDREAIRVLYGDGTLRVMWPGSTATQYEDPAVEAKRLELQALMDSSFNEIHVEAEEGTAAPEVPSADTDEN